MTKTFALVGSHRLANPGQVVMMALGTTAERSVVWNFEFWSFVFVWDLVFGAWNFQDFD
jgi:hypothetical protein